MGSRKSETKLVKDKFSPGKSRLQQICAVPAEGTTGQCHPFQETVKFKRNSGEGGVL